MNSIILKKYQLYLGFNLLYKHKNNKIFRT